MAQVADNHSFRCGSAVVVALMTVLSLGLVATGAVDAPGSSLLGGAARADADPAAGGGVVTLSTSTRLVDTATAPDRAFTATTSSRDYQVSGIGTVPATGVSAIVVNVSVISTNSRGFVSLWPTGQQRPNTVNITFNPETSPDSNTAIVPVGSNGKISVRLDQGNAASTQVRVDVTGYVTSTNSPDGRGYIPTPATRVADSRQSTGQITQAIAANASKDIDLNAVTGAPTVPAAVFLNITAVSPTSDGSFRLSRPTDTATAGRPLARFAAGNTNSTGLIAPVSSDGRVRITNLGSSATHVLVDVEGFFIDSEEGGFSSVSARVLDTRSGNPIPPNGYIDVKVKGIASVPSSTVGAVAINIVAIVPKAAGILRVGPSDATQTPPSNINFASGSTTSNLAVVAPAETSGMIRIFNSSPQALDVNVDLQGWFKQLPPDALPPGAPSGLRSTSCTSDTGCDPLTPVLATFTPSFEAQGNDDSNTKLRYDWAITDVDTNNVVDTGTTIGQSTSVTQWTSDDGVLAEDRYYKIAVRATDIYRKTGPWSPPYYFGVLTSQTTDSSNDADDDVPDEPADEAEDGGSGSLPPIPAGTDPRDLVIVPTPEDATNPDSADEIPVQFPVLSPDPVGIPQSEQGSAAARLRPPSWNSIPWSRWGGCGEFTSNYKITRSYERDHRHPAMAGGYAYLNCGKTKKSKTEGAFGFRHIKDRHASEFNGVGAIVGRGWRDVAGWMIDWMTYDPDRIVHIVRTKPGASRFCYHRKFYLANTKTGQVIYDQRGVLLLGSTGKRIITAFTSDGAWCTPQGESIYIG